MSTGVHHVQKAELERYVKAGEIDEITAMGRQVLGLDGRYTMSWIVYAYGETLPKSTVSHLEAARGGVRSFATLHGVDVFLTGLGVRRFQVDHEHQEIQP
jgi:hypothetical protein